MKKMSKMFGAGGSTVARTAGEAKQGNQWMKGVSRANHPDYFNQRGHSFEILDSECENIRHPLNKMKLAGKNAKDIDAIRKDGAEIQHKTSPKSSIQREALEKLKDGGEVRVPKGNKRYPNDAVKESKACEKRLKRSHDLQSKAATTAEIAVKAGFVGAAFGGVISVAVNGKRLYNREITPKEFGVTVAKDTACGGITSVVVSMIAVVATAAILPEEVVVAGGFALAPVVHSGVRKMLNFIH